MSIQIRKHKVKLTLTPAVAKTLKPYLRITFGTSCIVNLHNPAEEEGGLAYDVYADDGALVTLFMENIVKIEEVC